MDPEAAFRMNQIFTVVCDENEGFLTFEEAINGLQKLAFHNGKNTTITMIGDSTMRYQFHHLCCMLNIPFQQHQDSEYSRTQWGFYYPTKFWCDIGDLHIKMFIWAQKIMANTDIAIYQHFTKAMYDGSKNDFILLNYGLHQDTVEELNNNRNGLLKLASSVRMVYDDTKNTIPNKLPIVIWRETSPTHFPSTNGWYYENWCNPHDIDDNGKPCQCVALTDEMRQGIAKPRGHQPSYPHNPDCLPQCLPANARNTIALSEIGHTNIVIERIYDALDMAPFYVHRALSHRGLDCVHLNVLAINIQNQIFVSTMMKNLF
jgi:hypothetical protein